MKYKKKLDSMRKVIFLWKNKTPILVALHHIVCRFSSKFSISPTKNKCVKSTLRLSQSLWMQLAFFHLFEKKKNAKHNGTQCFTRAYNRNRWKQNGFFGWLKKKNSFNVKNTVCLKGHVFCIHTVNTLSINGTSYERPIRK